MKNTFFAVSLLIFSVSVFAQNKEAIPFDDITRSEQITKYRRILLDKFIEKDFQAVKQLTFTMMKDLDDKDYVALYPAEYWMLMYWTQNYMKLARTLELADITKDKINASIYRIPPSMDFLYERLKRETIYSKDQLLNELESADLHDEIRDFLILFLEDLTIDNVYLDHKQDRINQLAKTYISSYPNSAYNPFVKEHILIQYKPKNWGFTIEFFTGTAFFTQELAETYTSPGVFGVAFDICYRDFELYLRNYLGWNKTKRDLEYSGGIYYAGLNNSFVIPEASLGYNVFESKRIKLSPFGGIAGTLTGPPTKKTEDDEQLKEISYAPTTWVLGFNFDLKLGKDTNPDFYPRSSFGFLRLRYSFNMPQFSDNLDGFKGNYHNITIGFGGFIRNLKRAY
jgi:hypothetical protein